MLNGRVSNHPPSRWQRLFAIDLRSLALFRIALGALILAGVALRMADFRVFYTEDGVWPLAVAWGEYDAPGAWSLNLLDRSFGWQAGLALAEAAAGLALLLGWRTRMVAVLAWVLVASAHKRDVMVLSAAAHLLRQFLFWGMWLPLGARWSLDARRASREPGRADPPTGAAPHFSKIWEILGAKPPLVDRRAPAPCAVLSMASAALLLQVVLVYVANVFYKSDPAWRITGDAVWMALSQEAYTRPAGRALLAWPGVLRGLTHATFALEALGPWLAFIPWGTTRCRLLAAALFISFHTALAATMSLGLFPFISIAGWIVFLPGTLWARGEERPSFRRSPWPVNAAAAACFSLVVCWNLRPLLPALKRLDPLAHLLRLEQRWAMFAPKPREVDTWWVVVGTDARGIETNLWTGESPVNWKRPPDFAAFFPNDTWKLYFHNLRTGNAPRARLFAEWLARRWLAQHPGAAPLTKLEVYQLEESIYRRGDLPDNYLIYDSSAVTPPAAP
jgi:hypothetical protein